MIPNSYFNLLYFKFWAWRSWQMHHRVSCFQPSTVSIKRYTLITSHPFAPRRNFVVGRKRFIKKNTVSVNFGLKKCQCRENIDLIAKYHSTIAVGTVFFYLFITPVERTRRSCSLCLSRYSRDNCKFNPRRTILADRWTTVLFFLFYFFTFLPLFTTWAWASFSIYSIVTYFD